MRLSDSLRQTRLGESHTASEHFLEAKREVMLLARQGRLMTPHDAWAMAGASEGRETLWSIAYRIGTANDVSPDDICRYLESQFPRYTKTGVTPPTWDDIRY